MGKTLLSKEFSLRNERNTGVWLWPIPAQNKKTIIVIIFEFFLNKDSYSTCLLWLTFLESSYFEVICKLYLFKRESKLSK